MVRARLWGSLLVAVVVLVPLAMTLLATSFAALMVSDTYVGVEMVAGRGVSGTYVVTEVERTFGKSRSSGTFTSDDGTVVLTGATFPWGDNDLGGTYRAQYVPSLRTGRLPIVVSTGVWLDVASPLVGAVLAVSLAGAGWWLTGKLVRELLRTSDDDDPASPVDPTPQSERTGMTHTNDGAE